MNHRWLIVPALLLSLGVAACQPIHAEPAAQTTTKTAAEASAESALEGANKAVVKRFYDEVFTGKKLDLLSELFSSDFAVHDLDVGGESGGPTLLQDTLTAFPDVTATIEQLVVENDLVTAIVQYKGTHKAEFLGVAATGKPATWNIIDVWRVKDGKIVELWHNVPNEDILEQIGPAK